MTTMNCPHACMSPCSTCENSEAGREMRALRIVADAARTVVDKAVAGGAPFPVSAVAALDRALAALPKRSEPR